ncbi:MAG TPA: hypothetical protein VGI44_01520, partial [Acidimicrobiales bacterium]
MTTRLRRSDALPVAAIGASQAVIGATEVAVTTDHAASVHGSHTVAARRSRTGRQRHPTGRRRHPTGPQRQPLDHQLIFHPLGHFVL